MIMFLLHIKDKQFIHKFPDRIIHSKKNFTNGRLDDTDKIINYQEFPQDQNNWGWKMYYKLRKFVNKLS